MNIWQRSGLYALGERLRLSYEKSNIRRIWENFGSSADPADCSLYARFLAWLYGLILKVGSAVKNSVLFALVNGLKHLYFKITNGSLIFGLINKASLHRWFLFFFAAYLPLEFILRDMLSLGIIASVWEELFMVLSVCLIIWRACIGDDHGNFKRVSTLETGILLYISVMLLLMMITRPNHVIAFAGLRAQVEYTLWFFIIYRLLDDISDAKALILAFGAVVLLLSFHGIWQFIIAVPIPASWTTSTESAVRTRVFSITGSPNIFGSLLVLAAPIPAAMIYYLKKPLHKFLALCATGAMCLCDLFTFSRGSWIGLALAVVIFAFFVDKRLILAMVAVIGAILAAVPSITNRLTFMLTKEYAIASSVGGRALRWATGKELLANSSRWFGFGLGRFGGAVAMNNQVIDTSDGFTYFYMDNYYLKTMVESGYIGLAAFILLIGIFLFCGLKAVYRAGIGFNTDFSKDQLVRNEGNPRLLAVAVFSGMCGVLAHCYFENIFEEPYMMAYFWGLAAALISLGKTAMHEKYSEK